MHRRSGELVGASIGAHGGREGHNDPDPSSNQ
jgi:hypothetical protein